MKFVETELQGAFVIEPEMVEDNRGFFARSWCSLEFSAKGLNSSLVQANISYNRKRGTLRGMHYQSEPYTEVKLVRCTRGAICDVIIDLRIQSPTYKKWIGVKLAAENYRMLYVPGNFAHGFLTLKDDTEVVYQVSEVYTPAAEHGLRYNDPLFDIHWPLTPSVISEKDQNWPDYSLDEDLILSER